MAIQSQTHLDQAFAALSHQTRRDILTRLMAEPGISAGQFSDQFDAAQPTISRHLSQLERAGLIRREVRGRTHVFFAEAAALSATDAWMAAHRAYWQGSLKRLGAYLDETPE